MRLQVANDLAQDLLGTFGLLDLGWTFAFDRSKRRFGYTIHSKKRISLSSLLVGLNDISHVEKTLRHEIAHALVGPGHHHDEAWKTKCFIAGAEPIRYYDQRSDGHLITSVQKKLVYECPSCHRQWRAHKKWTAIKHCTMCAKQLGVYDESSLLKLVTLGNGLDNLFAELK